MTIAIGVLAALALTSSKPQPTSGTGNPASMLRDRKQAKTIASLRPSLVVPLILKNRVNGILLMKGNRVVEVNVLIGNEFFHFLM